MLILILVINNNTAYEVGSDAVQRRLQRGEDVRQGEAIVLYNRIHIYNTIYIIYTI